MRLAYTTFAITLVVACMSPHRRRIYQAKQDGNEPLAECYETCTPDDETCAAGCKKTFPTRWYHAYAGAAKPFIEAGMAIQAETAVALHPLAVQDAREHNPPLAACYEACDPADAKCLRACDAKHGTEEDKQRRRDMYLTVATAGLAIYLDSRRHRVDTSTSGSTSGSSDGSTVTTSTPGSKPPPTPKPAGSCTCKGWPLGSPDAKKERPAKCAPMSSGSANACDSQCKASGFAIGLFQSGSC